LKQVTLVIQIYESSEVKLFSFAEMALLER